MRRNKDQTDAKKTKDNSVGKDADKRSSAPVLRKSVSDERQDIVSTTSEGSCVSENSSVKKDNRSDTQGDEMAVQDAAGSRHDNAVDDNRVPIESLTSSTKSTPDLNVRSKKAEGRLSPACNLAIENTVLDI